VSAHADALATLRAWQAPSASQAGLRDEYVAHLDAHPDGLRRACAPGHLTAGVLVLSEDRAAVLLNLHGRARRWFHFGGHWEPGDASLLATATREAAEESGVSGLRVHPEPVHLDRHEVEFCRGHADTAHLDVRYAALAPAGATPASSDESLEVRWWPLDALPPLEPEMHDLIRLASERLQPEERRQPPGASDPSRRAPEE
jgi:8-oxo-dGTP pyrophosphatase MutT (NUDIX family)